MKNEVLEVFESAKKAADAAAAAEDEDEAEEARCVDALKQLSKLPVTMQLLIETQVGKGLRPLSKHPRQKIQAVASELLKAWKKVVLEENMKNKNNGKPPAKVDIVKAETLKVEKIQTADSVMVVDKVSRAESVKVEKSNGDSQQFSMSETIKVEKNKSKGDHHIKIEKTAKQEKEDSSVNKLRAPPKLTSMIKCNDSFRDKTRELLAETFSNVSNEADENLLDEVNACDPNRVAVSVESALFEKLGRSNGTQKHKYRSIMFNIRDPKNPDLRRRLLLGQVKPERLVSMTPEEMASDQRKQENNQIREKTLFDCELGGASKATTDQFKCGRCGQRKTTYYQMQTRSADEPMTTYVTCVNCNNHWKFC